MRKFLMQPKYRPGRETPARSARRFRAGHEDPGRERAVGRCDAGGRGAEVREVANADVPMRAPASAGRSSVSVPPTALKLRLADQLGVAHHRGPGRDEAGGHAGRQAMRWRVLKISPGLSLVGVPARQEAVPGGRADALLDISVLEEDALRGGGRARGCGLRVGVGTQLRRMHENVRGKRVTGRLYLAGQLVDVWGVHVRHPVCPELRPEVVHHDH